MSNTVQLYLNVPKDQIETIRETMGRPNADSDVVYHALRFLSKEINNKKVRSSIKFIEDNIDVSSYKDFRFNKLSSVYRDYCDYCENLMLEVETRNEFIKHIKLNSMAIGHSTGGNLYIYGAKYKDSSNYKNEYKDRRGKQKSSLKIDNSISNHKNELDFIYKFLEETLEPYEGSKVYMTELYESYLSQIDKDSSRIPLGKYKFYKLVRGIYKGKSYTDKVKFIKDFRFKEDDLDEDLDW